MKTRTHPRVKSRKRPFPKRTAALLLLLPTLCLALTGCLVESYSAAGEAPAGEETVPVTLRLITPSGGNPSRGLTAEEEARVSNLYVFFIREGDGTVHSVVPGEEAGAAPGEGKTFTARLEVAGSAGQEFRCVVLANAASRLSTDNLNLYKGKTYAEIQRMLLSDEITGPPLTRSEGFIMWGEAADRVAASRRPQKITVGLTRALARVDIGLGADPDHWNGNDAGGQPIPFRLKGIYVFKPNDRYAYMPVEGAFDPGLGRVTVPSTAGRPATVPFRYAVPEGATAFTSSIYLPEADIIQGGAGQPGDANHTRRCALVVQGSYDNHPDSYYRIDFRNGPLLCDLLRNHRYRMSVTSVSGDGEKTPEEAYESRTVNITATVLAWNDWSQDVIFDGVDHVYVEQKKILLPGNAGIEAAIAIESNVEPAQWLMSLDGVNFTDASIVSDDAFEVTKPALKAGGSLRIKTKTRLADSQEKNAVLTVKIHRLAFEIAIEQRPDTPEDWTDGDNFEKDF